MMERRTDLLGWSLLFVVIFPWAVASDSPLKHHRHSKRAFVTSPEDRVALVGEEVHMECSTTLKDPMTWFYSSSDRKFQDQIYYGGEFAGEGFKSRYQMDTNRTGQYALVIPRVDTGHAGSYRCDDDEGLVKGKHPAELTVLENRPSCSNSQPGRVKCNVNAVGNLLLKVTCRTVDIPPPEKKDNIHSFSKEFEINEARTCKVCFWRGSGTRCVFETKFDGIPADSIKTVAKAPEPHTRTEQPSSPSNIKAITVSVVVVVIVGAGVLVLAIAVFLYKRKTRRARHAHSIDPVNVEDCQTIDTKESLCPDSHQEEMKKGDTEVFLISGVSEV